jgi:hypothetical protein
MRQALPDCRISHSPRNPWPAEIGAQFGRWDVEFANGVKQACEIRDDGTASVVEPGGESQVLAPVWVDGKPFEPFPHQAEIGWQAVESFPRSYLFCDEVGLGKTIEAGLVLRSLILNGELQRILIVAPRNLVRQWMEELREKFALTAWFYDGHMLHDVGGRVRRSEDPWAEDGIARRRSSTVPRTCRRVWKR